MDNIDVEITAGVILRTITFDLCIRVISEIAKIHDQMSSGVQSET